MATIKHTDASVTSTGTCPKLTRHVKVVKTLYLLTVRPDSAGLRSQDCPNKDK